MPVFGWKYVFTSPEKVIHNVDEVIKVLEKRGFNKYFIVEEYGENSDNPHLNVSVQGGGQSFKNMTRDLKKAYYGKKLQEFENIKGFKEHGVKDGGIPDELGLKNFANYLKKELDKKGKLVKQSGLDIYELTKEMEPYDAEKCRALKAARKDERESKTMLIKELVRIHNEKNLGKPSVHTYQICCSTLAKQNNEQKEVIIPLTPLLNRPIIYYIQYSNYLGDWEPMARYLHNALKDFEPDLNTQ